ncbi:hypothetical protein EYF80_062272 [Liparis tanakae]|uniref:Uncharacterized protein n=1 Tax=Liparis tanakae TaxID=230148 RepID=A0A4Z2EFN6_9TELE|nr:hypothetical protein EYF80_062272 [Liparis tanakae]
MNRNPATGWTAVGWEERVRRGGGGGGGGGGGREACNVTLWHGSRPEACWRSFSPLMPLVNGALKPARRPDAASGARVFCMCTHKSALDLFFPGHTWRPIFFCDFFLW